MGARMTHAVGPDGVVGVPFPSAAVLHAWADAAACGDVAAQIARLRKVRDAGWTVVVALPDGPALAELAVAAAEADLHVIRWSPAGLRRDRRVMATAVLAGWLAMEGVAVVHAHDDTSTDVWRTAARRRGVPLVWDVDRQTSWASADARRLAHTSYLITMRAGARLAGRRHLPPNQPGAGAWTGEWFDLAEDGDLAGRLPVPTAICEVYSCLTGIASGSPTDTAHVGDPVADVLRG